MRTSLGGGKEARLAHAIARAGAVLTRRRSDLAIALSPMALLWRGREGVPLFSEGCGGVACRHYGEGAFRSFREGRARSMAECQDPVSLKAIRRETT